CNEPRLAELARCLKVAQRNARRRWDNACLRFGANQSPVLHSRKPLSDRAWCCELITLTIRQFDPEVIDRLSNCVEQLTLEGREQREPRDEHGPHAIKRLPLIVEPEFRGSAESV